VIAIQLRGEAKARCSDTVEPIDSRRCWQYSVESRIVAAGELTTGIGNSIDDGVNIDTTLCISRTRQEWRTGLVFTSLGATQHVQAHCWRVRLERRTSGLCRRNSARWRKVRIRVNLRDIIMCWIA
jgi:hypothetical protein